ncbi:Acyl-CoA reductase [Streptoalloteichus tenebrarius]|uniref:Acyl-CoA reductase n=1 Tax=Streptoalloteichus tenebrarius (strain ATCC 17920 / DSM 40477 / JCM 4838 / CBS 697.72 / NBRC 16177 / NCIMB 11028 / NRRL B-12390 / A12253. 1 / ISP 5477) TaxID=1933 RepID=A0ABT1HQ89_STRSD|nr:aldehyde dehydrogenase family protein [Streptoalloteichus tenebrarius]MCP2257694.1 Acyl-CoA reductase [Streptoalloteichus tenebrarius]BFE99956.1 aldehyde dehydrogenase family protein [Streptoalloteichus tenebrarius]
MTSTFAARPATVAGTADAEAVRSASGGREVLRVTNPADGSEVGRVPIAGAEEVDAAVATARAAWPGWARIDPGERGRLLHEAAAAVADAAQRLAEIQHRETGRPLAEALAGARAGASTLAQYAELGPVHRGRSLMGAWTATDLMVPEPYGVVVALTPWNDPVAIACGLVGAAVVTGNTVVHKPSEKCPQTGLALNELIREVLPRGVLVSVCGDGLVGAQLAGHRDVQLVAHVGSTATGRAIAEAAARTGAKVLLENGGNDPLLVDEGVDPVWAAEQAAVGAFTNAGQLCTSVERIYVHRGVADEFVEALVAQARRRVARPSGPEEIEMGPLVDVGQRERVHAHVADAVRSGARALVGGEVPEGPGAHYPATVLVDCAPDMLVMREETFGPVAPVRVVDDFAQGLAEAAEGRYGLAATVLTPSMEHAQAAWRELPVGTVKVNAVFGGAPGGAAQPRGASGTGFGYGPELLDEMTRVKVVHVGPPTRGRRG